MNIKLLKRRDVFVSIKTRGGKSFCYQRFTNAYESMYKMVTPGQVKKDYPSLTSAEYSVI